MALATGSNKSITDSFYTSGKLFAGFPCVVSHNAQHPTYFSIVNTYVDLVKQSGGWRDATGSFTLDSDGWITALTGDIVKILIHDTTDYVAGNYTIKYTGTATLEVSNRTLTEVSAGHYTFDLAADQSGLKIWSVFSDGTVSSCNCYLTSEESDFNSGKIFRDDFSDFFVNNSSIRFMDMQGTNGSANRHVADIRSVTASSWSSNVPPEAVAELCNTNSSDAWVCMPTHCTDAYVTSYLTRLFAVLDSGLQVRLEYANETWNSGGSPFLDAYRYMWYHENPTVDASVSVNTCTEVGHGLTTGDEIRSFNTNEERNSSITLGNALYAIVDSTDTFRVASSNSNALSDTHIVLPTDLVTLRYKEAAGVTGTFDKQRLNHAQRSREIWVLGDAVFGGRCVHILGTQSASASSSTRLLFLDASLEAATDFLAIAPYMQIDNFAGWEDDTNQESLDHIRSQYDDEFDQIRARSQYTAAPLICYEGGDETEASTEDEITKADSWIVSSEIEEFYPEYGRMLANAHVREICFFLSHDSYFGTVPEIGNTSAPKYVSIQPYMTKGFSRGAL